MGISRRNFMKFGFSVGAAGLLPATLARSAWAQATTSLLDPTSVPQFVNACSNPLAASYQYQPTVAGGSSYNLLISPGVSDLGLGGGRLTHVWGYGYQGPGGGVNGPVFPGRSFVVNSGSSTTVTYNNRLVDSAGNPLPHALPIDTSLHWANPGGLGGLAPVPLVAHLHGGNTQYLSDGLPQAWSTPNNAYRGRLFSTPYTYSNAQEAGHLWYHDHAVGITRLNVYMGLAGNYIIRDANEQSLIRRGVLPGGAYEVGLVIQDRQFTASGELWYPAYDPVEYPDVPYPTHLPEFFGDVVLVNGKAWPVLDVEPRKYRFRILNGSDSRVYDMSLSNGAPFMHVGTELGLMDSPQMASNAFIAPGERLDVVIDFKKYAGRTLILNNDANAPYPDGDPVDPATTGNVMAFRVARSVSSAPDATVNVNTSLRGTALPSLAKQLASATVRRRIMLFEGTDSRNRLQTMIGPVDPVRDGTGAVVQGTLTFSDPVTERPALGATELWEFHNTTGDLHPIHMHLVDFRILSRQPFNGTVNAKINTACDGSVINGATLTGVSMAGAPRGADAYELGRKDTAKMWPGEVTRLLVTFRRPGEYVYHCHILSHEDHEMMRRYVVDSPGAPATAGAACAG